MIMSFLHEMLPSKKLHKNGTGADTEFPPSHPVVGKVFQSALMGLKNDVSWNCRTAQCSSTFLAIVEH